MKFAEYEQELLEAFDNDEMVQVDNLEKEMALAKQAAESYFNKMSRINTELFTEPNTALFSNSNVSQIPVSSYLILGLGRL
jgi:hypothetical protein